MTEKIGFVGVGRMGANMARRLKDIGFSVAAVYDVRAESAKNLGQEIGAEACNRLARVTELCDIIFTVVTDDNAMRKIYGLGGKKGDNLLTNARGKFFVNCATISPKVHIEVEKAARKAGAASLEACMASSITQAREGTLYLMCGGNEGVFNRLKPILERLSSSMRFIGPAGQAANVKALVNMVMNINTAALAEGLGLADALKIDLGVVREVFSQTGANSRVLQTDGEDMQNREHSCFFSGAHAAKDSGIALSIAKEKGLNLPLAAATKKQYDRMVKAGLGELDKSGIAELTFKGRGKPKRKSRQGRRAAPTVLLCSPMNNRVRQLSLLLAFSAATCARAAEPLPQAHAHNDYEHKRPLLDALDHGFCSVEADIYFTNGALLVAHDADKVDPKRTLEALYLEPLRQRVKQNGGSVYSNGPSLMLLIDFKTEAKSTYAALRPVLEKYREMLTKFTATETRTGAVTVVLSGNRPINTVAAEPERLVGIDGRLPDLDESPSPHLVPLVSDNWTKYFHWRGQGALSENERSKLKAFVERAHAERRKIRFWAVPDTEAGWRVMREAGVDLINTDDLAGLQKFLSTR